MVEAEEEEGRRKIRRRGVGEEEEEGMEEKEEEEEKEDPPPRWVSPEPRVRTSPVLMSSSRSLTSARPLFTAPSWKCREKLSWSSPEEPLQPWARGAVASSKLCREGGGAGATQESVRRGGGGGGEGWRRRRCIYL